jgi:predicted MFS family arabinose efflux permease
MRHHHSIEKPLALYSLGVIGFFYGLHSALPNYFNSSFLETFTDEKMVSVIYLIISALTILGFLSIHSILRKLGNYKVAIILILIQIATFYGLITQTSPNVVIALFIIEMCIVSFISLTLDIFLQKSTTSENTGNIRGHYMTIINMAWVFAPLLGGMLISGDNYKNVFIVAFLLLFPLLYLVYKNFSKFEDSEYIKISTIGTIIKILKSKCTTRIFIINIVLQTFYAWMTVYMPIYLHNNIGFNWTEISIIFTIMLIPFILVEIPLGKLADRKWGEKEIMAISFIILAVATGSLVFLTAKSLVLWAIMLTLTRIGAAGAEIMIETYFFKKINDSNPEILSLFRTTRPLSFFIAPLITTVGLVYLDISFLFVIIGGICLLTLYPIATLHDTN